MKPAVRHDPRRILSLLSELSGVPVAVLCSRTQRRDVALVRAAAAHLLITDNRMSRIETGRLIGRSDQTVSDLVSRARSALASGGRVSELMRRTREALVAPTEPADVVAPTELVDVPEPKVTVYRLPYLSRWRRVAGLTRQELAHRTGLASETVARLENGRFARLESIRGLVAVLLVAPSVLVGDPAADATLGIRVRQCSDCGVLRPLRAFVRIKASRNGFYGRCRVCRARRARERYRTDTRERERQKYRVRRTRARRAERNLRKAPVPP